MGREEAGATNTAHRWQNECWQRLLAAAVLACLGITGCRGALDDFSFKDFEFRTAFTKPDPLVVLRDSTDGDKRAWALGVLTEPKLKGGSDKDQDAVVQILSQAAVSENHILCRLAAIQSLSHFKDPRAVEGLKEAYYRASSMTPENATVVRCAALTALGRTGSPAALDLLVKVVGEPPVKGDTVAAQQSLDLRIAAARATRQLPSAPGCRRLDTGMAEGKRRGFARPCP